MRNHSLLFLFGAICALGIVTANGRTIPVPVDRPYRGAIDLQVDATDLDHRVFRVKETIPVKPGPLVLLYPRWLPGAHAPVVDAKHLTGLEISARGRVVAWRRDAVDMNAFHVDAPAGTDALQVEFQFLSGQSAASRAVLMSRTLMRVPWALMALYPAGYDLRRIAVRASLRVPSGWSAASSLPVENRHDDLLHFKSTSLEALFDAPVFAGRHYRRYELEPPGSRQPVALNVFAEREAELALKDEQLNAHRTLVQQADQLFGARPFSHYEFLLALTDSLTRLHLEHAESSQNVRPYDKYLKEWKKPFHGRVNVAHEYVHAWNGKFRKPRSLSARNLNEATRDDLLWLYEGLTEYWGRVLAARAGLESLEHSQQRFAYDAAFYMQRPGRSWRNLQDTTNAAILDAAGAPSDWSSWTRGTFDYYEELGLIWLDADVRIREMSAGMKSLDDFARAFFGVLDERRETLTYDFDDIVRALNSVQPFDWSSYLRDRLNGLSTRAPLESLSRAGWAVAYRSEPSEVTLSYEVADKLLDFNFSLGLGIDDKGELSSILWNGPAFTAGLAPRMTLVAVNWRAYSPDHLRDAIRSAAVNDTPLELLLREGDDFRLVRIDYRDGLRHPVPERIADRPDRLGEILAPR